MANTSVSSQGHTPLPKSWVDDRMRDLFDVKPPRLFPLESKVFESVKNRITGYESLDLERYYYSSDLGTRLEKKNWWNGVRVAVVNFFTGGKYELKNLVYNVNLVCFHSNADMHATFKYENIRQVDQKLREKRSDLLFNSNAPSKNVIKRYENQVMQDFIRNCDLINTPAVNSSDSYLPPISSSNSTSPRLLTSRVLPSGPLPYEDEDFDHRQTVSTPPSSVS